MKPVLVRIPTPLLAFTDGSDEVSTTGATVAEVLEDLVGRYEGLTDRILDAKGNLSRFIHVFLGSEDVRSLQGLETPVVAGAVLSIIPTVAGGAS